MATEISRVEEAAREIRRRALTSLYWADSGHPGSSLSVADIVATLFFSEIDFSRDRFILSQGHAVPSVYAALSMRGDIAEEELAKIIPQLDDKISELAGVVYQILSDKDEQERSKKLDHLRNMIRSMQNV